MTGHLPSAYLQFDVPRLILRLDIGCMSQGVDNNLLSSEYSYFRYIHKLRSDQYAVERNEARRMSMYTMKEYNQPSFAKQKLYSYGAPRKSILPTVVNISKDEEPDINMKIKIAPRQASRTCNHRFTGKVSNQFCDVLGPSFCIKCIERTNRTIAKEIEHSVFPTLDCSATTLVAPKLAAVMIHGDAKKQRRRSRSRAKSISRSQRRTRSRSKSQSRSQKRSGSKSQTRSPNKKQSKKKDKKVQFISFSPAKLEETDKNDKVKPIIETRYMARAKAFLKSSDVGPEEGVVTSTEQQRMINRAYYGMVCNKSYQK